MAQFAFVAQVVSPLILLLTVTHHTAIQVHSTLIVEITAWIKLKGTSECSLIHSGQVPSQLGQVAQGLFHPSSDPPEGGGFTASWGSLILCLTRQLQEEFFLMPNWNYPRSGRCLSFSCCAPLEKAWLCLLSNPALGSRGLQFKPPQSFLLRTTQTQFPRPLPTCSHPQPWQWPSLDSLPSASPSPVLGPHTEGWIPDATSWPLSRCSLV